SAICVKVAGPGRKLPAAVDPRAQYPFTTWLDVFVDRQVPLSVLPAAPQQGESGTCFSVDGTPTAARLPWGTLVMAGQPSPAPPTVVLPGPVSEGSPLPTSPPPPP